MQHRAEPLTEKRHLLLIGVGGVGAILREVVELLALFEPWDVGHALSDWSWVNAMHEELENFERNQV
jgi:hypothetical protein